MITLNVVLIMLLWLILGLFICHKANWFKHFGNGYDPEPAACIFAVLCAPVVFIVNFINRFFIQKWH